MEIADTMTELPPSIDVQTANGKTVTIKTEYYLVSFDLCNEARTALSRIPNSEKIVFETNVVRNDKVLFTLRYYPPYNPPLAVIKRFGKINGVETGVKKSEAELMIEIPSISGIMGKILVANPENITVPDGIELEEIKALVNLLASARDKHIGSEEVIQRIAAQRKIDEETTATRNRIRALLLDISI